MREDMQKKIIERGRVHGDKTAIRRSRRDRDYENMPSRIGHSSFLKLYGGASKSQTDTLNPIYRFLDSKIGCKWDDVFSEMMEYVDNRSPIGRHVLSHLDWHIAVNCRYDDRPYGGRYSKPTPSETGLIYHNHFETMYGGRPYDVRKGQLYVDPNDGIIKRAGVKKKRKTYAQMQAEKPVTRVEISPTVHAVKCDGIWYRVDRVKYDIKNAWQWWNDALVLPENYGRSHSGYWKRVYHIYYDSGTQIVDFLPYGSYYSADDGTTKRVDKRNMASKYRARAAYQTWKSNYVEVNRRQMSSSDLRKYGLKND